MYKFMTTRWKVMNSWEYFVRVSSTLQPQRGIKLRNETIVINSKWQTGTNAWLKYYWLAEYVLYYSVCGWLWCGPWCLYEPWQSFSVSIMRFPLYKLKIWCLLYWKYNHEWFVKFLFEFCMWDAAPSLKTMEDKFDSANTSVLDIPTGHTILRRSSTIHWLNFEVVSIKRPKKSWTNRSCPTR